METPTLERRRGRPMEFSLLTTPWPVKLTPFGVVGDWHFV